MSLEFMRSVSRVVQHLQEASSGNKDSEEVVQSIPILILGRVGSPKAQFINAATSMRTGTKLAMDAKDVYSKRILISGYKFNLINTPGLDDPEQSNLEVFKKISTHLLKNPNAGVTGIVYIHRASDSPQSRALRQAMNVLSSVILGRACLSRLTILVESMDTSSSQHSASVATGMAALVRSVFRPTDGETVRTMVSNLEGSNITNLLMWYATKDPIQLRIQRDVPRNLGSQIEQSLGYYETDSMKLLLEREKDLAARHYRGKIIPLETSLNEHKTAIKYYGATSRQIEHELTSEREEVRSLRQKLQQREAEYTSLRSHFQLQENIEQQEIVYVWKDLALKIEGVSQSFTAYLLDNYARSMFGKDTGDVTTLDARQLLELKQLFGHVDGRSSLVASSSGKGTIIEDFFELAIRHLLCAHLYERIFTPFHPGVDPALNRTMSTLYDKIRQQEPQVISAKWRASSFKNIYQLTSPNTTAQHIDKITNDFLDTPFSALTMSFLGDEQRVELEQRQLSQIKELVRTAWDWNATLKGEVIVLGDFHPTYYDPHTTFEPSCHQEFEPRSGVNTDSVLGTLTLGLTCTQSMGNGSQSEVMVVCKALVATESIYD